MASSSSSRFKKPSSSEAKRLTSRQENVFKKASELSILCGVEVCVIYYGSYGELKTWPADREKVKDMARRYSELSETQRSKKQYDLRKVLESIKKDDESKKKKTKTKKRAKLGSHYKYPDWDPRFDNYSAEKLEELIMSLERSQTMMQRRLGAVVEAQTQKRNMHYTNMARQEQMMIQQRPNQASMDLFNPRISTLSQSQASTSASNQAYSLAPDPLTIYQDPCMEEMYSRLLGSQETGMNEVFNTSMFPYNSFNSNCVNVLPNQLYQNCFNVNNPYGVQETGTNGLQQNMDMYGYNSNTNGYPHQLFQTPSVYQYMDRSTQDVKPLYQI
ncbi:AGAMOUS-like 103 [Raphanus sativus]|uniref:Agamous-like MADS-box protein AGL103 n=1 Tax=Raphanus sativus TaxID=3726 RepID=A0A6J0NTY2_RAPSA|nr:agamous-like MADS-box protein AGL103 [Raphanus sativus]XP_056866938.1 agamous-like MADS-box protein AGL103 [Raphanus sativus]KAJ4870033.1 AGAMOUS-like 103 [Raphanus sativus]KAJ4897850.1 AGAMOUS-like 103 [Raphanus sativus]